MRRWDVYRGQRVGSGRLPSILLFLAVATVNAITVCVEPEGISRRLLWKQLSFLPWKEVREVGVCGTKPFHSKDSDRVGVLYIYISPEHLSEQERFDMIVQWPPRDKIYLLLSKERLEAVQLRWSKTITMFNSGKFHME